MKVKRLAESSFSPEFAEKLSKQAPFPYFGGKSRASAIIWKGLGQVDNYVEPFAGSLAVLLNAPRIARTETVNDLDGFVCNFWRSIASDPDTVARFADWPVNENDLHARHSWLVEQRTDLTARLEGDPDFHDPKIAGWWAWGIACWIGSGWCSGRGPWVRVDGKLVKRKLVHLGDAGRGVHRKRVHLINLGRGVHRKLVHLGDAGQGVREWFSILAARLRRVRVCCGDWSRVCGTSVTTKLGVTGIVLDPPYSFDERTKDLYSIDSASVSSRCREWAMSVADNPKMRIAFCGYDDEHEEFPGWTRVGWSTSGGYGSQGNGRGRANASREVVWFSPGCVRPPGKPRFKVIAPRRPRLKVLAEGSR